MLTKYISNPEYDLEGSFVIGDRPTDVELAKNIGCRAIYLQESIDLLERDWKLIVLLPLLIGIGWLSSFAGERRQKYAGQRKPIS